MTGTLFVKKSANAKTGPIPVTYSSSATCPDACPLKNAGCYASAGFHTRLAWQRADKAPAGSWEACLQSIRNLPGGTLWRHNVAGDLPGVADTVDRAALLELAKANIGRKGFTYTHKPAVGANLEAIREATALGFAINLSADNLAEADELAETGLPIVVILAADAPNKLLTPAGRTVQVCPAITGARKTCQECGACSSLTRKAIIGFPVHGPQSAKANLVANGGVS